MAEPTFWGPSCGGPSTAASTSSIINVVGPGLYGVIGDGVEDDTAALQSAIDDSYGKILAFVTGDGIEYRITSELTITDRIEIWGNGATINGADLPVGTGLNQQRAIHAYGTADTATPIPVTATLDKYGYQVSVLDSSPLAKDDLVFISNLEPMVPGYGNAASLKGFLSYVELVDSPILVSLSSCNWTSMDHTQTLTMVKVNPLQGLIIKDLNIQMKGTYSVHGGIRLSYCTDFRLDNVVIRGCEDHGIATWYCYGGEISNCRVYDATSAYTWSPGLNTGYAYVFYNASRDIVLRDSHAYNCRRGCTGGNQYPAIYISTIRCIANGGDNAWGTHEPCFYWLVEGCKATNMAGTFITVRGSNIIVRNNICIGNGVVGSNSAGIRVRTYYDDPTGLHEILLEGNLLTGTGGPGIYLDGIDPVNDSPHNGGPVNNVTIRGGAIIDSGTDAIYIQRGNNVLIEGVIIDGVREDYSTDGNGIFINGGTDAWDKSTNITIRDVRFKNLLRNAIRADYCSNLLVDGCKAHTFTQNLSSTQAVYMYEVDNVTFRDCEWDMSIGYYGYWLENVDNVTIDGGYVKGGSGLVSQDLIFIDHVDGATGSRCKNITIRDLTLYESNRYGLLLRYCADILLDRIKTEDSGTFQIVNCDYVTAKNCHLTPTTTPPQIYSLRVEDCLRLTATDNYFFPAASGQAGIYCFRNSGKMEVAIITGNNFGAFTTGTGVVLADVNYPIVTNNNFVSVVGGNKVSISGDLQRLVSDNFPGSVGLWKTDVNGTTHSAKGGEHCFLLNASATTVTLPAAASQARVQITVANGREDNVVDRNGQLIMGLAENLTLDGEYDSVTLEYIGGSTGWRIVK